MFEEVRAMAEAIATGNDVERIPCAVDLLKLLDSLADDDNLRTRIAAVLEVTDNNWAVSDTYLGMADHLIAELGLVKEQDDPIHTFGDHAPMSPQYRYVTPWMYDD
jgi:hypothetical protein